MTSKLCFMGNSHLAAVKDGHKRYGGKWTDLAATFIGAHDELLLQTSVDGGVLRPRTKDTITSFERLGMPMETDLNAQDAIVITGCGMALSRAAFIYAKARYFDLPSISARDSFEGLDFALVSKAAFAAMLQGILMRTLAGKLVRHLSHGTKTPILVASQPRTGIALMEDRGKTSLGGVKTAIWQGDAAQLSRDYDSNASVICEAMGATFLQQPPQTITRDVLTLPAFTKGAIRLSGQDRLAQPQDDILHANAAYGSLIIEQALRQTRARNDASA